MSEFSKEASEFMEGRWRSVDMPYLQNKTLFVNQRPQDRADLLKMIEFPDPKDQEFIRKVIAGEIKPTT